MPVCGVFNRLRAPLSGAAVVSIGVAILFWSGGCESGDTGTDFNGTALKNTEVAPEISLTNQFNESIGLNSFRDRVVVLTFLYTQCPDVCPIITSQLRDVHSSLGVDADLVEFVAVSVDPERDTPDTARAYLERWGLVNEWQYLVGEQGELTPIWRSYFIDPFADGRRESGAATPEARGARSGLSAAIAERYLVIHSAPVFLIDREGRRRVVFTSPFDPEEIVQDIRTLLK